MHLLKQHMVVLGIVMLLLLLLLLVVVVHKLVADCLLQFLGSMMTSSWWTWSSSFGRTYGGPAGPPLPSGLTSSSPWKMQTQLLQVTAPQRSYGHLVKQQ